MAVVMDYQNVHMTAARLFMPDRPLDESLIEPWRFASQLARAKNTATPDQQVEVARVEVFRGTPIVADDPVVECRNRMQKIRWERGHAGRVQVTLQPLRYRWETVDGIRAPISASRHEKGVDVMCALALMRLVYSRQYDVVVLASRDTDLAPALDEAVQAHCVKVEATQWFRPDRGDTYSNIATVDHLWTTLMTEQLFRASRDTHVYQ